MAHVRQSRPDSGLGVKVQLLKTVCGVLCSLGSGDQLSRESDAAIRRSRRRARSILHLPGVPFFSAQKTL